MELEEKLTSLRKKKGLTQQELAEALNVSRQAISKWEVGTAVPSTDNLIHLGRLYGISVDVLVNDGAELEGNEEVVELCEELTQPEAQVESVYKPKKILSPVLKGTIAALCILLILLAICMRLLFNNSAENDIPPLESLESDIIDITSADYTSILH